MEDKQFIRNSAYYQMIRDEGGTIQLEDLDFQFNDLSNYINDQIVTMIKNIGNTVFVTEIQKGKNDEVSWLFNDTHSSIKEWKKINLINEIESIPIEKFKIEPYFSVLLTKSDQEVQQFKVDSDSRDLVLMCKNRDSPAWSKVTSKNFSFSSILGKSIGVNAITTENLEKPDERPFLSDNTISSHHIVDDSIPGNILGPQCLSAGKLTQEILEIIVQNRMKTDHELAKRYTFDHGTIEARHFVDRSIPGELILKNSTFQSRNIVNSSLNKDILIPSNSATSATSLDLDLQSIEAGSIEGAHILDDSVIIDTTALGDLITEDMLDENFLKTLRGI